jgi:hypothetical protein
MPAITMLFLLSAFAAEPAVETLRYLRAGERPSLESEFKISRADDGSSIESTTHRGPLKLTVEVRYDKNGRLTTATAREAAAGAVKSAAVRFADGKAVVTRHDGTTQEFAVAAGVIVTSAPDWTDTLMLCRRYDRAAGGRQEFPGLWIHPVQPAKAPTFVVERAGAEEIAHAGGTLRLTRLTITLRPGSRYVAWADEGGKMVRLSTLPFKPGRAWCSKASRSPPPV